MSESITTCHLLESYWVVLSEWQKFMVSLQFIFCWRKHFFLMIIQKDFFYLIAITYWKLIPSTQKWVMTCSNITLNIFYLFKKIWLCDVRLYWMMPQDVFFLKSMENCLPQQKYHMKGFQMYNIWKQQHNSLLLFIQIGQVVQKLEPFKGWKLGDKKADVSNKFQPYPTDRKILQNR